MRSQFSERLEHGRIRQGYFRTEQGPDGAFLIQGPCGAELQIISGTGYGWEHVSVSTHRIPNWQEMCFVKGLFWDDDECVMELHPPKSDYVNNHPNCLHLWKPTLIAIPQPPSILVGYKEFNR